ncbi:MAG: DNA starvation/stationary phase protection protein Dps [Deltaproteobacteria bacterium]|nr:DNA starvation/stationary phase protection protein Dps [Deltaproteobacteria bacterium]
MKSFSTSIDMPNKTCTAMVKLLNQHLANLFDLYSQVKQSHWNVKGPQFYQLHKLYDELASEIFEYVDEIAERATALGGVALGTVRMAAAESELPEIAATLDGKKSIEVLVKRYAAVAAGIREAINTADEAGDKDTADLFTGISRTLDKSLWFLEAHLQGRA